MEYLGQTCHRCGRLMKPGHTKYIVKITVVADFDGVLPDYEAESDPFELFEAIEPVLEEDLEHDVYEDICLFLCKGCKHEIVTGIKRQLQGMVALS